MPRVVPSQVVDLIDKLFPKYAKQSVGERRTLTHLNRSQLVSLLEVLQQVPTDVLILSQDDYVEFTSSVATIRDVIDVWKTDQRATVQFIDGLRQLSPVALIRQALAKCPDEFPSKTTAALLFVTDSPLRDNLRLDISTTNSSLLNGEWKVATVMAGSIVEALLLWALEQRPTADITSVTAKLGRKFDLDMQRWDLAEYIEVCEALKLIKGDTVAQCQLARKFRNLIHPGRAQRLGQPCNRGTALSAVAAVEHVVTDLTPSERLCGTITRRVSMALQRQVVLLLFLQFGIDLEPNVRCLHEVTFLLFHLCAVLPFAGVLILSTQPRHR